MVDDKPTLNTHDIEAQKKALEDLTNVNNVFYQSENNIISVLGDAHKKLNELSDGINKCGFSLNNLGDMTSDQSEKFGMLGAAVIKARASFALFEGVKSENIGLFSHDIDELSKALASGGTAASVAADYITNFMKRAKDAGASQDQINNAMKGGAKGGLDLMKNMMENADNALKMQASMIAAANATGQLNQLYEKAGPNLANMNSLIDIQNSIMDKAKGATHSTRDAVQEYYMQLAKIPGALEANISGMNTSTGSMNLLTAAIKLAHGTGRDMSAINADMAESFKSFNLVGEDSLKFVSRFSELTNQKLGISFDDMKSGLTGAADAFKRLTNAGEASGKMTESISGLMNDYAKSLREAGMSGQQTIETVKSLSGGIAGLNVQQRAFLSAQTGGPGGLRGAAQIEQMLMKGDVDGVRKKVEESLKKQFGRVISIDEATKSDSAAAQRQKQIQLLTQGPLGQMVKPEDAGKFLEAMGKGSIGNKGKEGLDQFGLKKNIELGTKVEETSTSVVSGIADDVSAIRSRLETANLGTMQKLLTARAGTPETPTGANAKMKEDIKNKMTTEAQKGGRTTEQFREQYNTKGMPVVDRKGELFGDSIQGFIDSAKHIPNVIKSAGEMIGLIGGPNKDTTNRAVKDDINNVPAKGKSNFAHSVYNTPTDLANTRASTVAAAPRGKVAEKQTGQGKVPEHEVHITKNEESGKFKINVAVSVHQSNDQAKSITPVPSP